MDNNRTGWYCADVYKGAGTSEIMYPLYCPLVSCCQVVPSEKKSSSSETHKALGASLLPTRIASKSLFVNINWRKDRKNENSTDRCRWTQFS